MVKTFLFSSLSFSPWVLVLSLTPVTADTYANAIAIIIAALFMGAVNIIMARASVATAAAKAIAAAQEAIAPVAAKVETIVPVVARIDAHVNSEKTRMEGESAAKTIQIDLMRETVEELKKAMALLAQAKATTDMATAITQAAHGATNGTLPPLPVTIVPAAEPLPVDVADKPKP